MSVLIISAVFTPEPVVSAKLSHNLAVEFSKNNDVIVFTPQPTRPAGYKFQDRILENNFEHVIADSFTCPGFSILGRLYESLSFGLKCFRFISLNSNKLEVIYSNTWPLLAQYYTVKAAKKNKIPIIIHVQDIYPESLLNILPFGAKFLCSLLLPIDKYVVHNATKIIAISEKMKSFLIKSRKVESNKIIVVPNWQDENDFIEFNNQKIELQSKSDLFTFMYLGNIGPLAGIEVLLESFSMANLQNSRLVIAGSGSLKDNLFKHAKSLEGAKIEFWPVPEGKVPEIQNYADVLLLPVKKGGALNSIPSKLAAYMFSKKPVIACVDENSDTAETIRNANCGWILKPENIEELSDAMKRIVKLTDEELKGMGANGFSYAISKLSKKTNIEIIIDTINQTFYMK